MIGLQGELRYLLDHHLTVVFKWKHRGLTPRIDLEGEPEGFDDSTLPSYREETDDTVYIID
mgnify:CR=1 FL=1